MNKPPTTRRLAFRLRHLLLVIALVGFGMWGYRWVTWPNRTLRQLEGHTAEQPSSPPITFTPNYKLPPEEIVRQIQQNHLAVQERTLRDYWTARLIFEAPGEVAVYVETERGFEHVLVEQVVIQRGQIHYYWGLSLKEMLRDQLGGS